MISSYITLPNLLDTSFKFPEKISVGSVHRNQLFSMILPSIAFAFIFTHDPLKGIITPFTTLPEGIKHTLFEWSKEDYNKSAECIKTLFLVASVAAFFIPSLKKNLITSRTMSVLSVSSSTLTLIKRALFLYKQEIDLFKKRSLVSDNPEDNFRDLNSTVIKMFAHIAITTLFFSLALKTPLQTGIDRIRYCTESALKKWKITSWETLTESIQGTQTIFYIFDFFKLLDGTRLVSRLTWEVTIYSRELLVCAKVLSFYLNIQETITSS